MKLLLCFGILLSCLCSAQKGDFLDFNYNMSYRDTLGFKWTSKLQNKDDWNLQSFNSQAYWMVNLGGLKFNLTYDAFRNANSLMGNRYGLSFINSGPNTSINISLFNNDNFNTLDGMGGKIDINMRFK